MSKAFTKETDIELAEQPLRVAETLPEGAPNYLTPGGAHRLREELRSLIISESPATPAGDETIHASQERRRRAQRMRELSEMLRSAQVIPPPGGKPTTVQFGALVTVREGSGDELAYRIVGVHETDLPRGWISWLSPLAKALINARIGDTVQFDAPVGVLRMEIIHVMYPQE